IYVWGATIESFAYSPIKWIIGNGFGSFKHFFPLQEAASFSDENKETFTAVTFRQAHNDWLQLISELGLIGFGFFLFLFWRFFFSIYQSIKSAMLRSADPENPVGQLQDEHILLIMLGAAMTAQFAAAVPDFPFHRIETALYAVVVMGLVPVLAETSFFYKNLPACDLVLGASDKSTTATIFGTLGVIAGLFGIYFEVRCYQADVKVRTVDAYISSTKMTPEMFVELKKQLQDAIRKDPLPGDPYLKMGTLLEMEGKGFEAQEWLLKAWKNINFNARSTYHSVVFRQMHTEYYILQNRKEALKLAQEGLRLTAGDARSIYYFYVGKIAMELGDLKLSEFALKRCLNYPNFLNQAGANLAIVLATMQKWQEAYNIASTVSNAINHSDATMFDVMGISLTNLGNLASGEEMLRKAIGLNPSNPVFKRDLGVTLVYLRKFEEGKKLLQEALDSQSLPPATKGEINALLASISVATPNTISVGSNPSFPEATSVASSPEISSSANIIVSPASLDPNLSPSATLTNSSQQPISSGP
ncbi:tetratricopeptide repeat protein, partial [bacterium]|nr:tetratricopeptide repeat protein [bacterium]